MAGTPISQKYDGEYQIFHTFKKLKLFFQFVTFRIHGRGMYESFCNDMDICEPIL